MQSNLEAILAGLHDNARLIETLEAGDTGGLNAALRRVVDLPWLACRARQPQCLPAGLMARWNLASRITAGTWAAAFQTTAPRANGLGQIALRERRPVIAFETSRAHPAPRLARSRRQSGHLPAPAGGGRRRWERCTFTCTKRSRFQPAELAVLGILAQQAASALFQSRQMYAAYRGLARKEDELNRMRHAGLLISSRISLEETLQVILQMALEVTGAHYGILRLIDPSGEILNTRALAGDLVSQPLVEALPIAGNSVTSWVARSRQPVCIPDLRLEPWNQVYYPLDANLEMRSELAVPLIGASGRLEGVINLESPQVNAFNEDDRLLLQSLATQALVAIQEVRLLDALQEAAQLLLDRPLPEALNRLVELACELLNATAGMAWLREGDHLNLEAAKGPNRGRAVLPLYASLTGQAVRTGLPVTSDDLRADPRFHYSELAVEQAWTRALIVPMIAGEGAEAVGALGLYSSERQAAPSGTGRMGAEGAHLPGPIRRPGGAKRHPPGGIEGQPRTAQRRRDLCRHGRHCRQSAAPPEQQGRHHPGAYPGHSGQVPPGPGGRPLPGQQPGGDRALGCRGDGNRAPEPLASATHSPRPGGHCHLRARGDAKRRPACQGAH